MTLAAGMWWSARAGQTWRASRRCALQNLVGINVSPLLAWIGTRLGENLNLTVGRSATKSRQVTDADVVAFAELTLDNNPVHLDDGYAATTRFGRRMAHGMFAASLVAAVLGTEPPGPGCIYLSQELKFRAPVFIDDVIEATVTVTHLEDGVRCTLSTDVVKTDGVQVLSGIAVVLLPTEQND